MYGMHGKNNSKSLWQQKVTTLKLPRDKATKWGAQEVQESHGSRSKWLLKIQ